MSPCTLSLHPSVLTTFDCPSTPAFFSLSCGCAQTPERIFLIMEHCAGGICRATSARRGPWMSSLHSTSCASWVRKKRKLRWVCARLYFIMDELTAQHFMRQLGKKEEKEKRPPPPI